MRKNLSLIILVLLFLYGGFSYAQEAPDNKETVGIPIVTSIEIRGLKRIEKAAILKRLNQRIGEPLSIKDVSEDVKTIYRMGYFENVEVEAEPVEGGIRLIYILKEKPTIIKIQFAGNKEFDEEKLSEQISLSIGSIGDITLIQGNVDKIKKFYQSKGYWHIKVVPILRRISENEANLTFYIEEGPKVWIDDILFEGNKSIPSKKIRKVMKTRPWWIFSYFTDSGYYESTQMEEDIERIKELYYDNGFLNVVVSKPEIKLIDDGKKMVIKIRISEGPRYRIKKIDITGYEPSEEKDIKSFVLLKEGEIFSKKKLRETIKKINDYYAERGYALSGVDPEIIPDVKKKEVSVFLKIEKGDIFRIGRIEIIGNTRTRDKVIRREMRLDEGDIFNSKLLRRSYERINNLNFFEKVQLIPEPRLETKTMDIDIKVKERPTGFLSIGGGYSTVENFVGMIELTQANLFGTGRYLRIKGEFGGRTTYYELAYRDPWFLDKPLSLRISAYKIQRDYVSYNKKATGGSIGLGKRFAEYWSASLTYKLERATVYEVAEDASPIIKDQIGTKITSSITPLVIRDSRDNFLDPSRGTRHSLYVTFAGIGGDNKFLKTEFDTAWYFLVTQRTVFSLRGRIGYATGLFGEKLPLYERFYLGGIHTIRGLGFGQGGPRDENGDVIGGTKEIILNLEYIFPIVEEIKLKGVVFVDLGRAYGEGERFGSDIRYTTGAGFRWISPFGPIRVEYGHNIKRKPDETSGRFEFAFGTFF